MTKNTKSKQVNFHLDNSIELHTKRVFKAPLPGLIVMEFKVDKYLTKCSIQSPSLPATLIIHNFLNFCHHFLGKFHLSIIVLFSGRSSGLHV